MTATQSTVTEDDLRDGQAAMSPEIQVSGSPLLEEAEAVLTRVVVDLHVTLPQHTVKHVIVNVIECSFEERRRVELLLDRRQRVAPERQQVSLHVKGVAHKLGPVSRLDSTAKRNDVEKQTANQLTIHLFGPPVANQSGNDV